MSKKRLISSNLTRLGEIKELSAEAVQIAVLYAQEDTTIEDISRILNQPKSKVRQHLAKTTFLIKKVTGDPEIQKGYRILYGNR